MDIKDKAANLVHEIGDKGKQLQESECCLMKNSCGYISKNPILSLGIAVASGFLLSRVLSGR
ncbi:conserved hypothetical protein [Crenothrix polyspora]|uniref:DUF883 domain-containing protein n=1 Tax=Crenothrix polyspora TaxID=360316 RepID=A0A1R4H014_9GAMM|nr:hypothetical protein [Crenothrix polyspora]SJM89544.1 conserved hypothetical protein [Crenothrix polyspora]